MRRRRRPPTGTPARVTLRVHAHLDGLDNVGVAPMTCTIDHAEHGVTDVEFARAGRTGLYRAVCGHVVVPGSLADPPGDPCAHCVSLLAPVPAPAPTTSWLLIVRRWVRGRRRLAPAAGRSSPTLA